MSAKAKVTFVIQEDMQKDMMNRIIQDGYGLRGKSQWVSDAIDSLLVIKNFHELVSYGDQMHDFTKAEAIVVDKEMKEKLDNAIIEIRKDFPILEGVKSRIVRTAIIQRLLRRY